MGAFPRAMRELGYVEGKNLAIEWRFAEGRIASLPAMAEELVRQKVDVIATVGTPTTLAAQKATASIPIVMMNVGDPVAGGFAKSLARPGGNITGLSNFTNDVSAKHLEMLLEVQPRLARVAMLVNPANPSNQVSLNNVRSAAQGVKVTILPAEARSAPEVESVFAEMMREKAGALIVTTDPNFVQQWRLIAALAAKNRLPSVAPFREYAEAGGLMSYGTENSDSFRRAATYVDKIFKGAKPQDLPVEQPTELKLVLNRKTAKSLGLTLPQSLLISAGKVIE